MILDGRCKFRYLFSSSTPLFLNGTLLKSLSTGLRVLKEFTGVRSNWSVSDLSAHTGLKKSQLSKILATLRDSGFLYQDPKSREFSVALLSVALASGFMNSSRLAREASALMRELVDKSGQTVALCVLHEHDVLYLAAVEGPLFIDVGWRVGTWLPFHVTAVGKVLAAFLEEDELDAMIVKHGLPRFTPATICDAAALKAEFSRVRDIGVGETQGENIRGLGAMAVPVFGATGQVVASLAFIYPGQLIGSDKYRQFAKMLHDAARRLSAKLGAQVYPYGALADVSG